MYLTRSAVVMPGGNPVVPRALSPAAGPRSARRVGDSRSARRSRLIQRPLAELLEVVLVAVDVDASGGYRHQRHVGHEQRGVATVVAHLYYRCMAVHVRRMRLADWARSQGLQPREAWQRMDRGTLPADLRPVQIGRLWFVEISEARSELLRVGLRSRFRRRIRKPISIVRSSSFLSGRNAKAGSWMIWSRRRGSGPERRSSQAPSGS